MLYFRHIILCKDENISRFTVFLKLLLLKCHEISCKYKKYKQLEAHSFLKDVGQLPGKISYTEWRKDFMKTLNKYAPLKMKNI